MSRRLRPSAPLAGRTDPRVWRVQGPEAKRNHPGGYETERKVGEKRGAPTRRGGAQWAGGEPLRGALVRAEGAAERVPKFTANYTRTEDT